MLPSHPPVSEQTVLSANDFLLFMSKCPGGPVPAPALLCALACAPFLVLF